MKTLASYRAMSGIAVVHPADAEETARAWLGILYRRGPAGLVLAHQGVPDPGRAESGLAPASGAARSGYVLKGSGENPQVLLLTTGSEVSLALQAGQALFEEDIVTRAVNLPCLEWSEERDQTYRDSVIPPRVHARVSIEAGAAIPWYKYLGDVGVPVSIGTFGKLDLGVENFKFFGFTVGDVVIKVKESLVEAKAQIG